MKKTNLLFITLLLLAFYSAHSQYTEVINSNRPGGSSSAYSVGKRVIQAEAGFFYEQRDHSGLLTESKLLGADMALRYGFLFEQLELVWEGTFANEKLTDVSTIPNIDRTRTNFTTHTIGAKYLIYDPFKNEKKPNLYSWKANHSFNLRDLIPAVAIYAGANLNLGDNPFYPEDPTISPKVMIATQSHFMGTWVLLTNIIYDKFTGDDPLLNYVLTLTHALNNPKYSIFAEHQGFKSDAYGDGLFRAGAARLIGKDMQIDISLGANIKDTPSRYFGGIGLSYRIDQHKDTPVKQKPVDNLSSMDKKMLKKQKKRNKNKF